MTPDELHTAVLLALGDAGATVADSTAAPWHIGDAVDPLTPCNLHAAHDGRGVAEGLSWQDAHLVAALRNAASAALRGARRIIERHAPAEGGCCSACLGHLYADAAFPCVDYRDAARSVPNLPEEVSRALHQ